MSLDDKMAVVSSLTFPGFPKRTQELLQGGLAVAEGCFVKDETLSSHQALHCHAACQQSASDTGDAVSGLARWWAMSKAVCGHGEQVGS